VRLLPVCMSPFSVYCGPFYDLVEQIVANLEVSRPGEKGSRHSDGMRMAVDKATFEEVASAVPKHEATWERVMSGARTGEMIASPARRFGGGPSAPGFARKTCRDRRYRAEHIRQPSATTRSKVLGRRARPEG